MKHTTTLILLASLLTASMISCGSESADTQTTTAAGNDTTPATAAETEPARVAADLPERDFGGREFSFYGRIYDGVWSAVDLFSHEIWNTY